MLQRLFLRRRQFLAGGVLSPTVFINSAAASSLPTVAMEMLQASRTYHVSPYGSDESDGLSPERPLATLQAAWDRARKIYASDFDVIIKVADGTYKNGIIAMGPVLGARHVKIIGNEDDPTKCFLDCFNENCFIFLDGAKAKISGFKLRTREAGQMLMVRRHSQVFLGVMEFSDSAADHMFCDKASIEHERPYTISGSARGSHHHCILDGDIGAIVEVKIVGDVKFGGHYCANAKGYVDYTGAKFEGSAKGSQFYVHYMGVLRLSGVKLPGDVAGTFTGGSVDDNIQDSAGVVLRGK